MVSIGLALGQSARNSYDVGPNSYPNLYNNELYTASPTPTPDSVRLQVVLGPLSFGGGLDVLFTPTPTPLVAPIKLSSVQGVTSNSGGILATWEDEERLALATLVCDAFPFDRTMCSHVVWAESLSGGSGCTWRSAVYGSCWSHTMDCGLLQTNIVHAGKYEDLGYSIYVGCWIPEINIMVAQRIYKEQGPCAWTSYGC